MVSLQIARQRLYNQRIAGISFTKPEDLVAWMGFVQAQDYLGSLWALGLRLENFTEADVEKALADRSIVRTWPARGTLHFVAAQDVRWMLELLTPRVIAGTAGRYRQLGLDEDTFSQSRKVLAEALKGGNRLLRNAMNQVLESANISTAGQRGIHILGRMAQEGLICFGPREGKQHTFVLLEEWVPAAKTMPRDQTLGELARRYFTSHGPALLQDFVWWSGLTTANARAGLEMAAPHLEQTMIEGRTYWQSRSAPDLPEALATPRLLPAFDEYLVGYTDRTSVLEQQYIKQTNAGGGILNPTIIIDEQVVGTWKRTLKKDSVTITPAWFTEPSEAQKHALHLAALQYTGFLELALSYKISYGQAFLIIHDQFQVATWAERSHIDQAQAVD